jgi:demethylmenaquinone methyltransferase/2-methoxy-6-polyprenyl-1,4-benzoquinol methylase
MVLLRGDEKARYVAAMFDRISRRYDLLNTVMSGGMHHVWRRRAADLATLGEENEAPSAGSGQALDVGTGTGDMALELARRPGIERVVALDFASQMLTLAQAKAEGRSLSAPVHWILGDALNLPFLDDRFLSVTSCFGLRNFTDTEAALREMIRVIKPGGRVVILDIVPMKGNGILRRLSRLYMRTVVPRLGALLARDKEGYTYLPESVDSYLDPQELAQIMEGLGLHPVAHRMMAGGTVALHVGEKQLGVLQP